MATKTKRAAAQVPATRPVRVEVRLNGGVRFAGTCYDVELNQEGDVVALTASLVPTMVDAPATSTHQFGDDARDGAEVIQQVHSGRRA